MEQNVSEAGKVWVGHINAQRASGLSQKEWCKREALSVNTLQHWIKRLHMQTNTQQEKLFAKVIAEKAKPRKTTPETVSESSHDPIEVDVIRMRIPMNYDTGSFVELLSEILDR